MVCSGLPRPNEGRHIVEISNMALDLLSQVAVFRIRHKPDQVLKLRIGIHTGPCAAGCINCPEFKRLYIWLKFVITRISEA